jgi:hypothetical protein
MVTQIENGEEGNAFDKKGRANYLLALALRGG